MLLARRMTLWALVVCLGIACARPQESPASPTTGPATAPPALSKMSLGTSKTIADTVIFVGIEKQLFQQQGLDVELENLGTAETAIPALAAEQIQLAGLGIAAGLFNAINRGIPIKIVADKVSNYAGQSSSGLAIRRDVADSVKALSDLRGRVIAVASPSVSLTVELARGLEREGLSLADVDLQIVPYADMPVALHNGRVDGAMMIEPNFSKVVEDGDGIRFGGSQNWYPGHQISVIMYSPETVRGRDLGERFMEGYVRAARYYTDLAAKRENAPVKAEMHALWSKYTGIHNVAILDEMPWPGINPNGYVNAESIGDDQDWYLAQGYLTTKLDLSSVIDNSFVDGAVQRTGPYSAPR
jgi:NitT/TauT family transport system substrate-binding protein